jgi:hypothetical protein
MAKIVAICLLCLPLAAQTYNLSNAFSLEKNPNGMWQYGYSLTNSLAPDQFQFDKYADTSGLVGFWHAAKNNGPGPGYYPYVAFNTTSQSRTTPANGWAVRAGEIAMEASNSGQYSLIRFVAPKTGMYKVVARFEGIHYGLSSTDVHVLHNAASLFDAEISGYGGDPAFHAIEGANPAASYSGSVALKAGDTITFAVGYGQNKTHYSDTTGLSAEITRLSSPKNGE